MILQMQPWRRHPRPSMPTASKTSQKVKALTVRMTPTARAVKSARVKRTAWGRTGDLGCFTSEAFLKAEDAPVGRACFPSFCCFGKILTSSTKICHGVPGIAKKCLLNITECSNSCSPNAGPPTTDASQNEGVLGSSRFQAKCRRSLW